MRAFRLGWLAIILCLPAGDGLRAADFEVFDGRTYNGVYYPRIDIIEWGEPSHMEFQVYWKGHPVEMSFELEKKGNRKVMLVHYYIPERKEHMCRRVLAPGHFEHGFMIYRDTSDKDMDNTIVSMGQLPPKKGRDMVIRPAKYASCGAVEAETARAPAGDGHIGPPPHSQKRTVSDKAAIKGKGADAPFADW